MIVRKYTLKPDKTEVWVVYETEDGDYIGTLHSKNRDFIRDIIIKITKEEKIK